MSLRAWLSTGIAALIICLPIWMLALRWVGLI